MTEKTMTNGHMSMLVVVVCLSGIDGLALSQGHYGISFVLSLLRNLPTAQPPNSPTWLVDMCNPTDHETTVLAAILSDSKPFRNNRTLHIKAAGSASLWLTDQYLRFHDVGLLPGILLITSEVPIAVFATNFGADVDTILAVPIENFGTSYNIITMPGSSIFHLLVVYGNTFVSISPARGVSAQREWSIEKGSDTQFDLLMDIDSQTGQMQIFFRHDFEAYQVHLCSGTGQSALTDFTGYQAVSDMPFGLIVGNCHTARSKDGRGSHMEEMVAHNGTMGYRFLAGTPSVNMSYGLRVLASANVAITLITKKRRLQRVLPDAQLAFAEFSLGPNELFIIDVTAPAMVALMWPTYPRIGDRGALYLVPPLENWYFHYFVRASLLLKKAHDDEFQIHLLAFIHHESGLRINNQEVPGDSPRQELGMFVWLTLTMSKTSSRDGYILHHVDRSRFNAYVTDISSEWALIHSAGRTFRNVYKERMMCKKTSMSVDDGVDNDCDGLFDEEFADGVDNDGDRILDEDISSSILKQNHRWVTPGALRMSMMQENGINKSDSKHHYGGIVMSGIVAALIVLCGALYVFLQTVFSSYHAKHNPRLHSDNLKERSDASKAVVIPSTKARRGTTVDTSGRFIEPETKKVKVKVKMKEIDEASNVMT